MDQSTNINHLSSLDKQVLFGCQFCSGMFTKEEDLVKHFVATHLSVNPNGIIERQDGGNGNNEVNLEAVSGEANDPFIPRLLPASGQVQSPKPIMVKLTANLLNSNVKCQILPSSPSPSLGKWTKKTPANLATSLEGMNGYNFREKISNNTNEMFGEKARISLELTIQTATFVLSQVAPSEDLLCEKSVLQLHVLYPANAETVNPKNVDWAKFPTVHCTSGEIPVIDAGESGDKIAYLFNADGKQPFLVANIFLSCEGLYVDEDNDATSWTRWFVKIINRFMNHFHFRGDVNELSPAFRAHPSPYEEKNGRMVQNGGGAILLKIVGKVDQLEMIRSKLETTYKTLKNSENGMDYINTSSENVDFFKKFANVHMNML